MADNGSHDRFGRAWFTGAVVGALLIVVCILVAFLIASLVDLVRPGTLLRGRDFRPTAVMAAVLIASAGFWWHRVRAHGSGEMLASLALTEVLLAGLIVFFTGSPAIDRLFLDWFLAVNLSLGLPWLVAIGLSHILR